jgi:hypothetical protein
VSILWSFLIFVSQLDGQFPDAATHLFSIAKPSGVLKVVIGHGQHLGKVGYFQ